MLDSDICCVQVHMSNDSQYHPLLITLDETNGCDVCHCPAASCPLSPLPFASYSVSALGPLRRFRLLPLSLFSVLVHRVWRLCHGNSNNSSSNSGVCDSGTKPTCHHRFRRGASLSARLKSPSRSCGSMTIAPTASGPGAFILIMRAVNVKISSA